MSLHKITIAEHKTIKYHQIQWKDSIGGSEETKIIHKRTRKIPSQVRDTSS